MMGASQLFTQIALGSAIMLLTVAVTGVAFWLFERLLSRLHDWFLQQPHTPKLFALLFLAVLWVLASATAAVWIWAIALWALGLFLTFEGSMYFSIVSFTTLGYGDVLLPHRWRLLGGLAAVNGLLNLGLSTALLVEVLRFVRVNQLAERGRRR